MSNAALASGVFLVAHFLGIKWTYSTFLFILIEGKNFIQKIKDKIEIKKYTQLKKYKKYYMWKRNEV